MSPPASSRHRTELDAFFRDLEAQTERSATEAKEDWKRRLDGFFAGLLPALEIAEQAQRELDRRVATRFSVFHYFHERETDLSRILAGLLRASDPHGQGGRFLACFFRELLENAPESTTILRPFGPACNLDCRVHTEYAIDDGRIDIVIRFADNRWIGIENKPWAGEQKDQIAKYITALNAKSPDSIMVYLSGNGRDPDTLPEDEDLRNRCITMPYRASGEHAPSLEGWLRRCWTECEAERVRCFLTDIIEYIQRRFSLDDIPAEGHAEGTAHVE